MNTLSCMMNSFLYCLTAISEQISHLSLSINFPVQFSGFEFSLSGILLLVLASFLLGFAKAGMKGTGLVIVPIMAAIFGAKASTGILLPMLIIADIMAVIYYRRNAQWKFIIKLLPWTALGIVIALIVGNRINEDQFRITLTVIVILMLILMIVKDLGKKKEGRIPDNRSFAIIMGIIGGFATMIGNSAGPVFTVYLLAMGMPKKEFIGTGAWFFLIINISKLPLHIVFWETITFKSLALDLATIPLIAAGILSGIWLVNIFPEKAYRYFVIAATLVSALVLFIK